MTLIKEVEVKENILNSGDYSSSFNRVVFNQVDPNSKCLDVGCWNGNMGEELIKNKNCSVDGVDFREDMLTKAKERGYTNIYTINLNSEAINFDVIQEQYDYILFADVLEHLLNPELVLRELFKKLKPGGKVVVSLPNVAFALNRLNLLLGKWEYKDFGTLDKTHLRFFTVSTGEQLVKKAGYKVVKVMPYNQFGILTKIAPLDQWFPNLLCYQFLVVGEKNE